MGKRRGAAAGQRGSRPREPLPSPPEPFPDTGFAEPVCLRWNTEGFPQLPECPIRLLHCLGSGPQSRFLQRRGGGSPSGGQPQRSHLYLPRLPGQHPKDTEAGNAPLRGRRMELGLGVLVAHALSSHRKRELASNRNFEMGAFVFKPFPSPLWIPSPCLTLSPQQQQHNPKDPEPHWPSCVFMQLTTCGECQFGLLFSGSASGWKQCSS